VFGRCRTAPAAPGFCQKSGSLIALGGENRSKLSAQLLLSRCPSRVHSGERRSVLIDSSAVTRSEPMCASVRGGSPARSRCRRPVDRVKLVLTDLRDQCTRALASLSPCISATQQRADTGDSLRSEQQRRTGHGSLAGTAAEENDFRVSRNPGREPSVSSSREIRTTQGMPRNAVLSAKSGFRRGGPAIVLPSIPIRFTQPGIVPKLQTCGTAECGDRSLATSVRQT
jgi:hypothetical protein